MLPERFSFVFLYRYDFDLFASDRMVSVTWGIITSLLKFYPGAPPGTDPDSCQGTHHRLWVFLNVYLKHSFEMLDFLILKQHCFNGWSSFLIL